MARVLILSLVFPPDGVSTAHLYGELAEDLSRLGHHVTVITTVPHYNSDLPAVARQPLAPVWGRLVAKSSFRGIPVFHTAMPKGRSSILKRMFGWLGFHALSVLVAVRFVRSCDVVLTPSPPLTIGLVGWLIARLSRGQLIYNVQEMYPDSAVSLGLLSNPVLIRILQWMELFVYRHSYAVTAISPGMRRRIMAKGVPPDRVREIPNFADVRELVPGSKVNAFSREFELSDKFVVMYAGNMGHAQGLHLLVEAAEFLRSHPHVLIVLVGGGGQEHALRSMVADRALPNVRVLPYQSYERVADMYASADLCVVPLLGALAYDAAPSKIYRIMAAERSVLAITAKESDLAELVDKADAGLVVASEDPQEIAAAIVEAVRRDLPQMGRNGREYVLSHFDRPRVTRLYSDLLTDAASTGIH